MEWGKTLLAMLSTAITLDGCVQEAVIICHANRGALVISSPKGCVRWLACVRGYRRAARIRLTVVGMQRSIEADTCRLFASVSPALFKLSKHFCLQKLHHLFIHQKGDS